MNPLLAFKSAVGVVGTSKSFRDNPILGNPRLNQMGLHKLRVKSAARLAHLRRNRMKRFLDPKDVADFDRDGFVIRYPAIPEPQFEALRSEVFGTPLQAREKNQGIATTRIAPLSSEVPLARLYAKKREIGLLMGFCAGRIGAPVIFLQTITSNPENADADPQTALHADTFHSTAKLWLFLEDVESDDGPFVYVPGSHRLTKERLDWEYDQSLSAHKDPRLHHTLGSFRIGEDQLDNLGYGKPRRIVAKANTLVVADTFGFHRRARSYKRNVRHELHGYLRENPFVPWNGGQVTRLPGIHENQAWIWFRYLKWQEKKGKKSVWIDVGRSSINEYYCN